MIYKYFTKMKHYCFILGNNPTLSTWEIVSVLNQAGLDFSLTGLYAGFLFLKMPLSLKAELLERLGGTIKIVEILHELHREDLNEDLFLPYFADMSRVVFGFSLYDYDDTLSRTQTFKMSRDLNSLGLSLKKTLKADGKTVRLVVSKEPDLSSIIVEDYDLINQGGEWAVFSGKNNLLLGRTIASQKSFWYSWRDFGRPARDAKAGMLPPKLAKILINISGLKPDSDGVLLDPFCGSGTVIQEAGILGFTQLLSQDRDPAAIRNSKENWKWLEEKALVKPNSKRSVKYNLGDARMLATAMAPRSVDAIVSEGYLGKPMSYPSMDEIHTQVDELSGIYYETFTQFAKILKKGGRVAMTFPVFVVAGRALENRFHPERDNTQKFFLPITHQIAKLGFKPVVAFPSGAREWNVLQITERGSVLYGRPDQHVWREVFVWELL